MPRIKHHFVDVVVSRSMDFQSYLASLPSCVLPHLKQTLDWNHGGVETDLHEIADRMIKWEEKLSAPLGLTDVDVHDIVLGIQSLELQR